MECAGNGKKCLLAKKKSLKTKIKKHTLVLLQKNNVFISVKRLKTVACTFCVCFRFLVVYARMRRMGGRVAYAAVGECRFTAAQHACLPSAP